MNEEGWAKVGDTVRITGHSQFPGDDILPIGSEFVVTKLGGVMGAVEYQWGDRPELNWWILPDDYEVVR